MWFPIANTPQGVGRQAQFPADRGIGEQGEKVLVMKFGGVFA